MEAGEADQFAGVFADCADEPARLKRAQHLKSLILPEGMGSTFQVLQLRKGL
jgi:SAM-dependent MidA family methyltransferase